MAGHSLVLPPAVVAELNEKGRKAEFPLPDGKRATGVVERSEVDAAGNWVMSEGRLTEPAEGRFLFRRQPEGTPSGRYAGVVYFPGEDYGYTFEEGASGEPQLTLREADGVSCVQYPMPRMEGPATEELLPSEHPDDVPIPDYQNGVIPLESLPGATGVAYLDFDGEEGPHGGWGDFDAAPSGSSNAQIREVWARVAEDFAPFNVNVTTDLQVYLDAPETSRQRCIITPTTNAAPGAGGVAYIGSWNWGGDTPCWAFYSAGKASAEVISHEIGHTLGLGHDGQTPDVGYYGGHGNGDTGWAPIMGVGYYQNLSQWSKGEYSAANETQDDLAVIDGFNAIDFRADDHGNTAGAASALELFGATVNDDGLVSTRTDVDVFSFKTTGGTANFTIKPVGQGPNLDISAELRNSANALVATSNPDGGVDASFNVNLAAGTYTIHVDGTGRGSVTGDGYSDYGSLGHYAIDGTIAGAIAPDRFAIDEFPAMNTMVGTVTPDNNHGANPLTFTILSGNAGGAFAIGAATGTLTVANPSQFDHDALSGGWNDPAEFELMVQVTNVTQPALNEVLRVVVTVNDTEATAPVILKHRYSFNGNANDSTGGANLTLVGTAGFAGNALNLPGGTPRTNYAAAQGTALTQVATTINSSVAITIEGWFNQDVAQNWAKLFMAGMPTAEDYMDITPRRGADGNVSSHAIRNNNGGESRTISSAVLGTNVEYYVAATWDSSANRMTLHIGPVGGALSTYTASMGGLSLADITLSQFHIGAAVFYGDPDFDGQIDELRIWSGALSADKIAADFAAGPEPAGDSDLDGLPDAWEQSFAGITSLNDLNGNLSAGSGPGAGTGDFDGDGLSDADEYHGGTGGTDPTKADTDNDGFPDLLERMEGTDPASNSSTPQPQLKHRYTFNSGAIDAIGGANLTLVGTANVTGGSLELPGSATPRVNHARALNGSLEEIAADINSAYAVTVEAWFNQDTAQNWAKIFMAGKGTDFQYMDVTPRRGADGFVSSISINDGPGENNVKGGAPAALANNTDYYCAATWNTLTNQLTLRIGPLGGALQTHTATMGGKKLADLLIGEVRIGSAVQWGDPDFDGQINELRIWRGALSATDAAAHFAAGPVQPAGDIDADGLSDPWEFSFVAIDHLSDLTAAGDFDHDGLLDGGEFTAGSDPTDADSDNDGFSDGLEVSLGTSPTNASDKPVIGPATPAHRYAFAGNANDAAGSANLTLLGTATVAGGQLELPGGGLPRTNHASAQGTALTELAETIGGSAAISMEAWFNQDTAQNWAKLFMAGRGSGGEYLDITPRRGATGNAASISFNNGSTESTAIGNFALATDTEYYCAAVWNPVTDQLTLRIGPVGGALQTYTASLGGRIISAVQLNEFYLGAAVQFPDQDLDGQIKEFRVWKGALSDSEVAASFSAGPDAPPGDSDGDTLPDAWEFSFAGIDHLNDLSGSGDFDGDGLSNALEYANGADPTKTDTDGDGYNDKIEVDAGSDPNNANDLPLGPAVLAHRYSFNAGAADTVGNADLTLVGGAAVTGGKLNLPGGAARTNHATAQGAALTELATTITSSTALTIEAWFNQDTAQNWAKIFMAGQPSGFNFMDITPRRLGDGNVSSISINNGGVENNVKGGVPGPLANDTEYYFAATWNGVTNELVLRLGPAGGALQTHTATMGGKTLAALNIQQLFVGSAVQFGDPDFDGQIDELRIWKGALGASEVADHFVLGPERVNTLPDIAGGALNPAGTSFTLTLSNMIAGKVYHVEAGTTLQDFAPLAGSQFTANAASGQINVPANLGAQKARFFRIVEGPLP